MECLPLARIQQKLSELKDWALEGNALAKEKTFNSFKEAVDYVNKVAELSEIRNHHPDILIANINVRLVLMTHSANCVTETDFEMAKEIDGLG